MLILKKVQNGQNQFNNQFRFFGNDQNLVKLGAPLTPKVLEKQKVSIENFTGAAPFLQQGLSFFHVVFIFAIQFQVRVCFKFSVPILSKKNTAVARSRFQSDFTTKFQLRLSVCWFVVCDVEG